MNKLKPKGDYYKSVYVNKIETISCVMSNHKNKYSKKGISIIPNEVTSYMSAFARNLRHHVNSAQNSK